MIENLSQRHQLMSSTDGAAARHNQTEAQERIARLWPVLALEIASPVASPISTTKLASLIRQMWSANPISGANVSRPNWPNSA
jgi:hypothetical protein